MVRLMPILPSNTDLSSLRNPSSPNRLPPIQGRYPRSLPALNRPGTLPPLELRGSQRHREWTASNDASRARVNQGLEEPACSSRPDKRRGDQQVSFDIHESDSASGSSRQDVRINAGLQAHKQKSTPPVIACSTALRSLLVYGLDTDVAEQAAELVERSIEYPEDRVSKLNFSLTCSRTAE